MQMRHRKTVHCAKLQVMNTPSTPRTVNVVFRAPRELVEAIDQLAQQEMQTHGLPCDRSALIRRALVREIAGITGADVPQALALANVPTTVA
jgi:hypothetical protein